MDLFELFYEGYGCALFGSFSVKRRTSSGSARKTKSQLICMDMSADFYIIGKRQIFMLFF
ncbi:MAG: hypothetical protein NC320_11270 [Clostridium sp.]|nr:hypothetical protein [Clostridium sp.]